MTATHYLFAGPARDQVVPVNQAPADADGEGFVNATATVAKWLASVPADLRWEAAQGPNWVPSPAYAAWLEASEQKAS